MFSEICLTIIQVQAFIIAYLHEKMPGVFGNKRKEKEKLINNLAQIFQEIFLIRICSKDAWGHGSKKRTGNLTHTGVEYCMN